MSLKIRSFTLKDASAVKEFTDRTIGLNYFTPPELVNFYHQSFKDGLDCTLVLEDEAGQIRGIRLTFPHGNWHYGKGPRLSPDLWTVPQEKVAYFQSLFIEPSLTGKGWGKKLSLQSLELLKKVGAQAVVAHSWVESPHDSSGKYLRGLDFKFVKTYPLYWNKVDYTCPRCGKPCVCTAEEMILSL